MSYVGSANRHHAAAVGASLTLLAIGAAPSRELDDWLDARAQIRELRREDWGVVHDHATQGLRSVSGVDLRTALESAGLSLKDFSIRDIPICLPGFPSDPTVENVLDLPFGQEYRP